MKPEIKQRWVEALRSGNYEQAHGCLYKPHDEAYCCLGVLTDLAIAEGAVPHNWARYAGMGSLPSDVRDWAGLEHNDPTVSKEPGDTVVAKGQPGKRFLSGLNDEGKTFAQIADLIEQDTDL